MKKITLIKRYIVFFLIISFLNLTIIPIHAIADDQDKHNKDLMESGLVGLGIGLAVGLVVLVIWSVAKKSVSPGNPETINQDSNKIIADSNKILTPSEELIVLRW